MKKIFTILAVAFAALAAISVISCNKEDASEDLTAELIGSWRGTSTNGESIYTLTFTKDKLTLDIDGKAGTYSYKAVKTSEGKKYFSTEELGSFYYSISGTTMNIISGDSAMMLFFPKTFEKALL